MNTKKKNIEVEISELTALFWEGAKLEITDVGQENIYFSFIDWCGEPFDIFCKCRLKDIPESFLREAILKGIK